MVYQCQPSYMSHVLCNKMQFLGFAGFMKAFTIRPLADALSQVSLKTNHFARVAQPHWVNMIHQMHKSTITNQTFPESKSQEQFETYSCYESWGWKTFMILILIDSFNDKSTCNCKRLNYGEPCNAHVWLMKGAGWLTQQFVNINNKW